jgi:hypothetical protein
LAMLSGSKWNAGNLGALREHRHCIIQTRFFI